MPTKTSLICSLHFLGDNPSDDSGHPDYIPSQWPEPKKSSLAKKPKTEKDQKRFERLSDRARKGNKNVQEPAEDSDQVK
jgi:hypothetical protein